ncbi:zinc finger BED domain-containing protein RICESLEEPER 2-like [Silene latifolia]|uniref:zinc finger BED domain-containing protein RICESLEEPER 2-like n=1 Tax=Silene latifolia TaxID=37657 RepID=UPI003D7803F2
MDPTCHMATGFGEDVDFVQIEEDVEAIDIEVESQEPVKRRSKTTKRLLVKRKPLSKRSKAWDHFDESHKGDSIADAIEKCLGEWGLLSKLFTITVDNASSNDVACSLIRANMQRRGDCVADGRWNSTYIMLNTAQKFESAFGKYARKDPHFMIELQGEVGLDSGSDKTFSDMASEMKTKCDKYWGNINKMNTLIYISAILDPRVKLVGIQIALSDMYGDVKGEFMTDKVKRELEDLFDEYWMKYKPSDSHTRLPRMLHQWVHRQIMSQIRKLSSGPGGGGLIKTELQRYMNEANLIHDSEETPFDILSWWKLQSPRFPVLSRLARDVLAMPISTVASESAFSAGGRTLDQFRSSLTPKMVQALICAQDWFRMAGEQINVDDLLEDLENLEKDLDDINLDDNVVDGVDPMNA